MRTLALATIATIALGACHDPVPTEAERSGPGAPEFAATARSSVTITDLGTLGGDSRAYDVNDNGVIVGSSGSLYEPCSQKAFIWTPTTPRGTSGTMRDLGGLAGGCSRAYAVTNGGEVGGGSRDASGAEHPVFWTTPGQPLQQQTTNGVECPIRGMNEGGEVAGPSEHGACVWIPSSPGATSGTTFDIGTLPGGTSTSALDINDNGQVTGYGTDANGKQRAFLWTPDTPGGATGSMVDLGALPGATFLAASAINSGGQVAGWFRFTDGCDHAFLWTPDTPGASAGTMIDLAPCAEAYAINDQGQVAGWAPGPKGQGQTAVLWSTANNAVTSTLFLGRLGGSVTSVAEGISNKINGVVQVVGFSRSGSLAERATLWMVKQ